MKTLKVLFERAVRRGLSWMPSSAAEKLKAWGEPINARLGFSIRIQRKLPSPFKIGFAVLGHERAGYLERCLDSLFTTELHGYDVTFLIQDDGSKDPRVREIIERPRDPKYKIIRSFTKKGHNSWGAAFNKAIRKLRAIDRFDILGTCDSDAIFHPEWLDQTLKIAVYAKAHHRDHILGPFSSFNSNHQDFHGVLGTFSTPYGNYVVKQRMGALNYLYFSEDLEKLGFFEEDKNDETLMTTRFKKLLVRNFCTETSYVEHLGEHSVLNQWRPVAVKDTTVALNLVKDGWVIDPHKSP